MQLPTIVKSTATFSRKGRSPLTGAKEFLQRMIPMTSPGVEFDTFQVSTKSEANNWRNRAANADIRLGVVTDINGVITIYKKTAHRE